MNTIDAGPAGKGAATRKPARRRWLSYTLAATMSGLTLYCRILITGWVGERPMMVLFLPPVILSAYLGGLGPGLIAVAVSALGIAYFVSPPLGSFALERPLDLAQWLIFITSCTVLVVLIELLHRARRDSAGETPINETSFSTERKVQAGFALALICLGVVGVMSHLSVSRQVESAERTRRSDETISTLRLLLSTVTDAETSARGLVITGSREYLGPYEVALNTIPAQIAKLVKLTSDKPEQQKRLDLLAPLIDERMDVSAQIIWLRRSSGFEAAQTAVVSGRGKRLHDQIRAIVAQMEKAETDLLAELAERVRRDAFNTKAVILVGSALAFGVTVAALFIIGHDFTRSRRAAIELSATRDQLEERVRERTARLSEINEALKASESRHRDLVRRSPQAIFMNRDGRITFINEAGLRFFRAKHESEVIGRSPHEFIHPDFLTIVRMRAAKMLERSQDVPPIDLRLTLLDGTMIDAEMAATSYEEDGRLVIQVACQDITERKRSALAAARLAAIVECSEDAIIGKTTEGIVTSWNRGAENIFGYSAEEMIGTPITRLMPPGRLSEEADILARIVRGESVRHLETVRLRKDGRPVEISVTISPVKDVTGWVVGVSKIARDITERKQAEAELRERDARLHLADRRLADIVHGMTEACFTLDAEWRFSFVNARGETLLRHRREEMLGQSIWSVFHQLVGTPLEARYRHAMTERVAVAFEAFSPVAERWLDIRLFPTGDGLSAFLMDIESRKQSEKEIQRLNADLEARVVERTSQLETANVELHRSRAVFVNLFESLPGLYLVLAPDLKIVTASDAYLTATMTTREGIIGRAFFEVFPDNPDDPHATGVANLQASFNRVFRSSEPDTMAIQKYDIRKADGSFVERYWSPINSPVLGVNNHIEYIVHRVEDVTDFVRQKPRIEGPADALHERMEQMEAEVFMSSQKVQAANQQLESANQLLGVANKELEAFSYSVSHDLRAPLRAVDGFSLALVEDYGALLPAEGRHQLDIIRRETQRMGDLIDDLLSFSRLSRVSMSVHAIDMNRLVTAVWTDLLERMPGRRVRLILGDLPGCTGDLSLLRQVWINLLSNALKYTGRKPEAVIEIGSWRESAGVVYLVKDNGAGFEMRYVHKLFGVFQRLHRAEDYEGTGVGLAIVQRVVHRHGGRVWAESVPGEGSTFYFTLNETTATHEHIA
jgi:PAS domain S-box-containing protein